MLHDHSCTSSTIRMRVENPPPSVFSRSLARSQFMCAHQIVGCFLNFDISPKIKTMCLPAKRCHPTTSVTPTHPSVTPTHPSTQTQTNISSAICAHLLDSESMHIAATSQHPLTQTPTLKHPVNLPPHRDSGYFEEDSKVDCDLYCRERSPPPLPHLLG